VDDYLGKPYLEAQLLKAIRVQLERHRTDQTADGASHGPNGMSA
jgi:DNA-binding response OmpR family regulator